ncbi:zf-HC2 domain-containing protein [Streptomyces sp. NPDC047017]|uniref:anti-sigma factor family protein n=1 Tax=Streptomyces sp. NPDC047017 TaxID=3155024 RepID=UPI0033D8BF8E
MTSTTDTAGHPDVTEISDLTEGLLTPARAEELHRHLAVCAACAEVHASLEEIRGLLGALPQPQAMPDDVAARIDAALAAESDGSGDGTGVSRETAAADRPAGRPRTSATGPGRKPRARRGRRRIAVLGTAFTVAALGVAAVVLAALPGSEKPGTAVQGQSTAPPGTLAEGTLAGQVAHLLGQGQAPRNTPRSPHSLGADTGAGTDRPNVLKTAPTAPVPACVRQGIHRPDPPLAAEPGTYAGKDAYLVVLPDTSGDSTRVTAYVVDAACEHHPSVTAEVLLSHSYPRP